MSPAIKRSVKKTLVEYRIDVELWNEITLDSGINIGVRLLIFEKKMKEKKNEKLPQCLV